MVHYKLYYFNARGWAEVIRLALVQAGLEFEDIRFTYEEWPSKYKPIAPLGTAPWLEIDGRKIGQSMACARYIARKHGLMGSSDWEEAQVNAVCDAVADLSLLCIRYGMSKDERDKAAATEKIPGALKGLEVALKANNEGAGFFVGSNVSLADLRCADAIEHFVADEQNLGKLAGDVPLLKAHHSRIIELPRIKAWIAKRPQTPH